MRDDEYATQAACQPSAPSSGKSFGDITGRIDTIREAVTELAVAYENDVQVAGLGERAATIRRLTESLENALYGIDSALSVL